MEAYSDSTDLLARELRAHVTSIHHSLWNEERAKGAIDLEGVVDISFFVRSNRGRHPLVYDGANDQEEGLIAAFAMLSVELGSDAKGKSTTAPVIIPCDPPSETGLGDQAVKSARKKGNRSRCRLCCDSG